jgi:hypothetical protein
MAGTSGSASHSGGADREHGAACNVCSGPANNTSLVVQIERSDGEKLSNPADVRIDGPTNRTEKTLEGTDRFTFKPVGAGQYKISVSPNGEEDDFSPLPPHPQEATVTQGAETLATLKIAPPLMAYVHLAYTDPDDVSRDFPEDFKVVVIYDDGMEYSAKLDGKGNGLSGSGTVGIPIDRSKIDFTLSFSSNSSLFVICEKPGDETETEIGGTARITDGKRAFMLPKDKWNLSNSDWTVTNASNYAESKFTGLDDPNTTIGTEEAPVEFLLNPHWQYHKFEFFDRKFGESDHHGRVSIPPIMLEGFRKEPDDVLVRPDTISNWPTGTDAKDMKLSLPWILRKKDDGTPLDALNKDMELRFQTNSGTGNYIHSKSATERELKGIAGNVAELQPGPERMAYYDLPSLWRSRAYYTRKAGSTDGKFFYDLTEADITAADTKATPLIFCLDDIVLFKVGDLGFEPLEPLSDTDKVVIFHHLFNDSNSDCTVQGVYKTLPHGEATDASELPSSKVDITENYLVDYVDWTRLIIAQGNLFDVFESRTPNSDEEKQAVGARAAIRWVDAMEPLATKGFRMYNFDTKSTEPNGKPLPNHAFFSDTSWTDRRPGHTERPFFAMQHFWSQRTASRYSDPYNSNKNEGTGRLDIALLRCCGVEDDKEVAVNLHYLKSSYTFDAAPSISEEQYVHDFAVNVSNRWSGNDPGINESRARYTSRLGDDGGGELKPIVVDAVWFCQSVIESRAHFAVKVIDVDRQNRSGMTGKGESSPGGYEEEGNATSPNWFPAAHESGHMDALPDEYNEQWDAASYDQVSLKCNLPADPYRIDGDGAMMNDNEAIRNRYFWHAAEWCRRRMGGDTHLQIALKDRGGTDYPTYFVPEHGDSARTFTYWPLAVDQKPSDPIPRLPANGQGGLRDLFLYTLGRDHYGETLLPAEEDPPGATPYDSVLMVVVKLSFWLPRWTDADTNKARRAEILQAAIKGAESLNHQWYASGKAPIPGSAPATKRTFERCLIHFAPRVIVENFRADGEVAPGTPPTDPPTPEHYTFSRDIIRQLKLHYEIEVNKVDPPKTRWKTGGDVPDLEASNVFLDAIPTESQSDDAIQDLNTKIDEYHAIDTFHLTERITKIEEIRAGADAFRETKPDINATWSTDVAVMESRAPAAKRTIDEAMQRYASTGDTAYDERITKLNAVKTTIEGFGETVALKSGWSASGKTAEIDTALSVYDGIPADDYEGRLAALAAILTACTDYVRTTRAKKKFFNRGLYKKISAVNALEGRTREKRGEVGVQRGISVMTPVLAEKLDELGILKGTHTLKTRSAAVKKDLEDKEKSTTLIIESADTAGRLNAVRDAFSTYFLSMIGIHKLPANLSREDLIPLVKKVIPEDTDVQPVA